MGLSSRKCCTDRLNSLPNELICQILSSLSTKDAAVVSLSSKNMGRAFTRLTTLDFDDSPISYCARKNPQFTDRFQIFKMFVDNVLQRSQSPHLSRFRLGFGGDLTVRALHLHNWESVCGGACFPDLESTRVNAWIEFPLSRCGVREIDLRIHVRRPGKLPSMLFACETLEVLKLDTNLDLELVSSMPSFRFPNLKVLQLHSILIPEDDFVDRLVSNCPLLEALYMDCWWNYGDLVTISSPLLQKLVLSLNRDCQHDDPRDCVKIDTPNLRFLEYDDILAVHYTVASMKDLVEASIEVWDSFSTSEESFRSMISLVRAMPNVQHLSLLCSSVQALDHDDLKNELPVLNNLTHLVLYRSTSSKWNTVLSEFLKRSPLLETLVFPRGIDPWYMAKPGTYHNDIDELERVFFETNQINHSRLKRIVIKEYRGTKRDLQLVQFLLKSALVLEELLAISRENDKLDRLSLEIALKKLARASSTCLIMVQ